ncbi:MAG: hypothetical protein EBY39_09125 [Flavobacteriia bacterium]|nr:hypothetical protein [Flavobacteriia bacterium]
MKLYCFFTPSHEPFYKEWLLPSAKKEYDVIPIKHKKQISVSSEYRKSGWRETQYHKVLAWKKAVEENMGDLIICCDVDIQFIAESKAFLTQAIGNNDIAFQQNFRGGPVCSGFFICRCSLQTQNFLDIVSRRLKAIMREDGGGEQYEMQKLLSEKWFKLNVVKLSYDKVWCPGAKYESLSELNVPKDILVHHANWTEGQENKIDQLEHVKSLTIQQNTPYPKTTFESLKLPKNKSKDLKIAFCTSSLLRELDVSSVSWIKKILNTLPSKPDFIGHFPKQSKTKKNLKILESLKEYFDKFVVKFEEDPIIDDKYLDMNENMSIQRNGHKGNLYQWISMKKCALLVENAQAENGVRYDWVMWSRPDIFFFNCLDNILSLDNQYLYFPSHDNHLLGLYDRFCMGSPEHMLPRMLIFDYFIKTWYDKFHNNQERLTWSPYREKYLWNPEIVLRDYIRDELKIPDRKINLCSGKLRERFFARVPFWYSIYGTSRTGYECKDDVVNHAVLNKIKKFTPYKVFEDSPWHAVNVLEDDIMFDHPNRIKNGINAAPLDSDDTKPNQSFIHKLLHKLNEASLKQAN